VVRFGTFPAMFMRPRVFHRPASLVLLVGFLAACGGDNTKLMVTAIDPPRGDAEGGSYVHIRGNRFTADGPRDAKVYFGGRAGTVHRFASDSDIIVEAPGGKPNEVVDVLVIFEPGGQLRITGGFKFYEHNQNAPSVEDLNIKAAKDSKDKK